MRSCKCEASVDVADQAGSTRRGGEYRIRWRNENIAMIRVVVVDGDHTVMPGINNCKVVAARPPVTAAEMMIEHPNHFLCMVHATVNPIALNPNPHANPNAFPGSNSSSRPSTRKPRRPDDDRGPWMSIRVGKRLPSDHCLQPGRLYVLLAGAHHLPCGPMIRPDHPLFPLIRSLLLPAPVPPPRRRPLLLNHHLLPNRLRPPPPPPPLPPSPANGFPPCAPPDENVQHGRWRPSLHPIAEAPPSLYPWKDRRIM